jgi:hypothetical protein
MGLGVNSASYRNEYQREKYKMFLGSSARSVLAWLSRQCWILNIWQHFGPPRIVTGIVLCVDDVRYSQETHLWASTACYADAFNSLYVEDVCASQEAYLEAFTVCYGDSLTFLYVDDVSTSQKTHVWASTACYADAFNSLYVDNVCTSQEA